MQPFKATLIAAALTLAFSGAYAAEPGHRADSATYKSTAQKTAADYKAAAAQCTGATASEKSSCIEEAKVARARADLDNVTEHNNTLKARITARTALAHAELALAKAKCSITTGADKDSCLANGNSVHLAALADAKADRDLRVGGTATGATMATGATAATAGVDGKGAIANTHTREPVKAAAVDKCAQIAGQPSTGCLIGNKDRTVSNAAANTRDAAATVGQKTESVAESAVQKTKNAAAIVADKSGRAVDRIADRTDAATDRGADKSDRAAVKTERSTNHVADRTERAGERMAEKTSDAANRSGKAVADSVITTKVKADLFKEPELSAMAIHVETEKGVVMLSGFVDNKADADKAVRLAKSVDGVTQVKNAIKVK